MCRSISRIFGAHGARLALFALAGAVEAGAATSAPQPVSPGARDESVLVEARCPTFSWAGVPGAQGYQLAVFHLPTPDGAEPLLVARASVPADARAWTPPVAQCLERGERYAWSVAAVGDNRDGGETRSAPHDGDIEGVTGQSTGDSIDAPLASALGWAPALLFQLEAAPSAAEIEDALATLERYLETRGEHDLMRARPERAEPGSPPRAASEDDADARGAASEAAQARRSRVAAARDDAGATPGSGRLPVPSPRGIFRTPSAASAPALGSASLTVSDQIHLTDASALFKNGEVLLWDDAVGNTALGREALASVSGLVSGNTAVGRRALHNTAGYGSFNTAIGEDALFANTTGYANTASGHSALRSNTTGTYNTASGGFALFDNTTGGSNTATGAGALQDNTTGSDNTASGKDAMRFNTTGSVNTAVGANALFNNTVGFSNTASGFRALEQNYEGTRNTASGHAALSANFDGHRNAALGNLALATNTTGSRNTALGDRAGYHNTTGSDSIFVNNEGAVGGGDTAVIKIGTQGTQTSTSIAGIHAQAVDGATDAAVLVDATGRLGTAISTRSAKQDIQDIAPLAARLLDLRPVAFRYRQDAAANPDGPLQFGLIAEEVAEVFPELVVFDQDGRAQTVKYHLLSSLLLGELRRQHAESLEIRRRLEALESRVPRTDLDQRRVERRGDRRRAARRGER